MRISEHESTFIQSQTSAAVKSSHSRYILPLPSTTSSKQYQSYLILITNISSVFWFR